MDQSIPSVPPVFTQAPAEPEAPKRSYQWLIVAVIVFLLAVTSVFTYKYYQLKQQVAQTQVSPTPIPSAAASPISAPTTNWKDYSIEELKLTFKLPPEITKPGNFTRVETPSEKGKQICWALDMKQGFRLIPIVYAGGGSCTINLFTIGATTIDHEAGRESGFADYKLFQANQSIPSELITKLDNQYGIKIIKILGKNAPKIDPLTESGFPINGTPGDGYIGAILQNNDDAYQALTVQMKLTPELTPELFDLILFTFKFIDSGDQIPAKTGCKDPRPAVCTMECIQNPPYICGSDGNSYCSVCQACANQNVAWYEMKSSACKKSCGQCPQLTPPAPDFCKNGKIISGGVNECGCSLGPDCLLE